jgi:hypothetical protein
MSAEVKHGKGALQAPRGGSMKGAAAVNFHTCSDTYRDGTEAAAVTTKERGVHRK